MLASSNKPTTTLVQAAVVHWQTREGGGESKRGCNLKCDHLAVSSSKSLNITHLTFKWRVTSLHPVCCLTPARPCESLPPPGPGAPATVSVNNNERQTDSATVLAKLFCLREHNANTYRGGHLAPAAILWVYCITWHCLHNCDGPIISLFTKWTDKGRWLRACPGLAGCTCRVQHFTASSGETSNLRKVGLQNLTLSKNMDSHLACAIVAFLMAISNLTK